MNDTKDNRKATYKDTLMWLLVFVAGTAGLSFMMWAKLGIIGVLAAMFVSLVCIGFGMLASQ